MNEFTVEMAMRLIKDQSDLLFDSGDTTIAVAYLMAHTIMQAGVKGDLAQLMYFEKDLKEQKKALDK